MRTHLRFLAAILLALNGACGGGGNNGNPGPNPPAAPSGLVATAGNTQVKLTWNAVASAIGYDVQRSTTAGGPYSVVATPNTASYTDTSVTDTVTYYYVVSAFNSAGESGNSAEASATPQPPHPPTTFYVAPSGSDSWPGTLAQPFATVQFGVSQLYAGDTLVIHAGSYHETVTVSRSGSAHAPIGIQAYPGECPVIVGAVSVSGPWTVHSGSIYKTPWPSQPTQVFSDSHMLNEARWPNTPIEDFANQTYALTDSGTENYITSANLPPVNLTGAWIRIMAGQAWVTYDRQVSSHDQATGKLTWTTPINALPQLIPRRADRFYVFGKLELLDSPGEWWWDPTAQQLYVWTQDGAPPAGRVEAGTAPAVLDLSGKSFVTVKGLLARGGWFNLQNCTSCTVQDFHLWAPNWTRTIDGYSAWPQYLGGVDVSGTGNLLDGGSVRQAGRSGIHIEGTGNTIRQVTVEDSGWDWGADAGIQLNKASQAVVENCTVHNVSNEGIVVAPQSQILNNLVQNACLIMEDCGNINTWNMDGQGTEIAYNLLQGNQSRWGAGIYLDAGSPNFNIHDNVVQNVLWNGMNITATDAIQNNTLLEQQHQGVNFAPPANAVGADWSAGVVAHNQILEAFPLDVQLGQPQSKIPDWGYYNAYTTLVPQPGPRRVELDWAQFAQPGWSQQQVPMDLSEVDAINFVIDALATPFSYTITNLRLLPLGAAGDNGAVLVSGTTWTATCSSGSTCTLTVAGPPTWGVTGSNVYGGSNSLSAPLPAGSSDLAPYRGLAFDLAGTASCTYNFQGYKDVDNGPDAEPGRGATLPPNVGADPANAWPDCTSPPGPWSQSIQKDFAKKPAISVTSTPRHVPGVCGH